MRQLVFSGLVLAALAAGSSSTVRADGWPSMTWGHPGARVSAVSPVSAPSFGGSVDPGSGAVVGASQGYPYSYWAAWPNQARQYVGYGASDGFAFYGSPYGHANDRWSWSSLSGQNTLARYYYPPVR